MTKLALYSPNGNIDLTEYIDPQPGDGMEPGDPTFTEKVFARSLLKKGATFTLEHLREKEQVFPLYLYADGARIVNLIGDPSFEYDVPGAEPAWWEAESFGTVTVKTRVVQAGQALSGKNSFHLVAEKVAAAAGAGLLSKAATAKLMPVTAGTTYYLSAGFTINTLPAGVSVYFKCAWFKSDGVTSAGAESSINGSASPVSGAVVAPAEAAYARVKVFAYNGNAGEVALIDIALDQIMMSNKQPYIDGDKSRYQWAATPGNSISENYVGKEGLSNLIQRTNMILNTPGCQVEWTDAGATVPTYFDLISGQLDDEFDFRLGEQNWLKSKLRLFSQPLGYWTQNGARQLFGMGAIAGSAAAVRASAPVAVFQASGLLDGDAPALIQGHIFKENNEGGYPYVAMAVLPNASYQPLLPVASMTHGALSSEHASTLPDTTGVNGVYFHSKNLGVGSDSLNWRPNAGALPAYIGTQRLCVLARVPSLSATAPQFALYDPVGETYGPTQTAVATSTWTLYDLGTLVRASSTLYYGAPYEVNLVMFQAPVASTVLDVTAMIQLPDDKTVFLSGAQASSGEVSRATNHFAFDGVNSRVALGLNPGIPASGVAPIPWEPERYPVQLVDLTGFVRGVIPEAPVTNEPPVIAFMYANRYFSQNGSMVVNVNVLERTRYIF